MNFLEERILKDGIVKEGNVLKVDSFLNHQMDVELLDKIGEEFYRRFKDKKITKVLTIEASGIAIAYAVARFRFPGRDFLYGLVIFAKTIPIIGSGPAEFKLISSLGMVNNPALIWLAWAGGFDFAFIVLYGTFKGISQTYSEAAKIDGANNLYVLFNIILPQATPAIIALSIEEAIGIWNNYGTVMIYLREYPNLAYGLYLFSAESNYIVDSKPIYFAAVVISSIPPIVLYMANLNKILTNITTGGLKG